MNRNRLFKAILCIFLALIMVIGSSTPSYAKSKKKTTKVTKSSAIYRELTKNGMFDYEYYAANNPDVVAVCGTNRKKLLNHFLNCGIWEGRQPNADFNINVYSSAYEDLKSAFNGNADTKAVILSYYNHYAQCGKNEGRSITTYEEAAEAGVTVTKVGTEEADPKAENAGTNSTKTSVPVSSTPAYNPPANNTPQNNTPNNNPDAAKRIILSEQPGGRYMAEDYCYDESEHFIVLIGKDTCVTTDFLTVIEEMYAIEPVYNLNIHTSGHTNNVTASDIAYCDFSGTHAFDSVNLGDKYVMVISGEDDYNNSKHDDSCEFTDHCGLYEHIMPDGQKMARPEYIYLLDLYDEEDDSWYYWICSYNVGNDWEIGAWAWHAILMDSQEWQKYQSPVLSRDSDYLSWDAFCSALNALCVEWKVEQLDEAYSLKTGESFDSTKLDGLFETEGIINLIASDSEAAYKELYNSYLSCLAAQGDEWGDEWYELAYYFMLFSEYFIDTKVINSADIMNKMIEGIEAQPKASHFDTDTSVAAIKTAFGNDIFSNFSTWFAAKKDNILNDLYYIFRQQ